MKTRSDLGFAVIACGERVPRPDFDSELWVGSFSMGKQKRDKRQLYSLLILTIMRSDEADKPVLTAGLELHYELFRSNMRTGFPAAMGVRLRPSFKYGFDPRGQLVPTPPFPPTSYTCDVFAR